jgi:hypothetical protein
MSKDLSSVCNSLRRAIDSINERASARKRGGVFPLAATKVQNGEAFARGTLFEKCLN